jgi:hypothetical protein
MASVKIRSLFMDIEGKRAKLAFLQNFFFVSFIISFVLMLISNLLCLNPQVHEFQNKIMVDLFKVDAATVNSLVVLLFGIWKILIIQFTLIPGIAIWLIRLFCKHKKAEGE